MGLSRLDNFLKSTRGTILYVDPNNLDSTDSIENQGNSLTRPFKTIQRALIEAARFSYQKGSDNDTYGKTTILLYPGEHLIDNRPGWIPDGANNFRLRNNTTSADFTEFTLTSNFDLEDANNQLYKLNSVYGGVIVPRGTSIVGLDLRKTKIRPKYVPDPTNDSIDRSAIFRITGGCYFWQFTIFDANPNGTCYKNYTSSSFLPNFSHHKLSSFEYADGINDVNITGFGPYNRTDLEMYYEKVGLAYGQSSGREIPTDYPSASLDIEPRVDEYRIVGSTGQTESISAVSVSGTTITVTLTNPIADLEVDTPIRIAGFSATGYNGQYVVSEKVSSTQFKYKVQSSPANTSPTLTGTTVSLVSDTVSSASPYIFNISLRSVFGMCGILADGSKASGFKSMVVAQFTGIGLQKDSDAFVVYNSISGTFTDNTANENQNITSNSRAIFKPSYKNFHIKSINDSFIQCVSIFAIGYAEQFVVESGGDQSITNSNSNFGAKALVASGFRSEAFPQDDCGYITHIIPPREITNPEFSVEFDAIDIITTNAVSVSTRLFLYNRTNRDDPPQNVLQGYRIGAKPNDTLNAIIDGQEYSATITPDYEKVSFVALSNGLNNIASNIITFTASHSFSTGETVRVISDSGHLPDGLSPNTVYYAINASGTSIKLAKTKLDADNNTAITINNKGGRLKVISRISDKNSGDIGHPIQWSPADEQWYINVDNSPHSALYQKIVDIGSNGPISTPRTYIKRTGDDRNRSDLIYKFRYVIPKNIGGAYARPPIEGYVLQESNNTIGLNDTEIGKYFNTGSITNLNELRNFRFIADATWSSGTATANIITELPHNLTVGSKVEILNVISSNNSSGADNLGYNGTHTVVGIESSKHFSVSITSDPGTFGNDTTSRTTALPHYRRKNYKDTYYVYSIDEYQRYIEDEQDGVYHISILNSSNSPVNSPFTSEKFSQPIRELYPQINRDNPNSDPEETKSFAIASPIGNVVVNDVQNSITKETVSKILVDTGVGIGITNIVSSGSTTHTIYTDIDHGLGRITQLSLVSGGNAYGSGSGGTFYNARLVGFAGSTTGEGATVRITVNSSGNVVDINSVKIMDGGSAYGIGNTLSVVGVATTAGFSAAVVRVENVLSPVNDAIRISGVSSESYKDYNGVYRVSSVSVGSARSFSVISADAVSNYSTTGIGATVTENSYFYLVGKSISISNIQYNNVTGFATVTGGTHIYSVNNKVKISGATTDFYNGDFIISKINSDTSYNINIGIGTTVPTVSGTIFSYSLGATSNDGVISDKNENISGRMVSLYAGTITRLSSSIGSTTDPISVTDSSNIIIGDYLQIDDEIVRVRSTVTSSSIEVFRGVLGTRASAHNSNSAVKKINVKPIEFRRYSIIRASGHTFEYVGFGPGNYSTAFPDKQDRQISVAEELLSQGTSREGGVNYYSGMNDQGVFYSGNKRLTRIGGQEEIFDTPLLTITGEDIGNDRGVNLVNATEGNFTRSINIGGGRDGNAISEFNGPVVFNNKVTSLSDKGLEVESLFIQGNDRVSRKYTISDTQPTDAGNPGDIVYNSNPASNGYLGWVYTNNNAWTIFSKIGSIDNLQGVGVGTTGGFVGFSTLINFKGTNINIETDFNSSTGITTVNFIGSSVVEAISGYDVGGASGDWSTFLPVVSAGGTMEVGRYIDFHTTSANTDNYTFRLDNAAAGILTAYGNLNVLAYGAGKNGDITLAGELNFGSESSLSDRYLEFYTNTNEKVYLRLLSSDAVYQNSIVLSRDGIDVTGDINSTSDIKLKTNIHQIDNPLDKVLQIRGVNFDWKDTNKSSIGVIAQEIENIIPEVVSGDETKMVNYNGLVGVLIEAIKELKSEIDELKKNS